MTTILSLVLSIASQEGSRGGIRTPDPAETGPTAAAKAVQEHMLARLATQESGENGREASHELQFRCNWKRPGFERVGEILPRVRDRLLHVR